MFLSLRYAYILWYTCTRQGTRRYHSYISCLSDWIICRFDSDRKSCLYPITWRCLSPITWSAELRVWMVLTSYSGVCNICNNNIVYQIGQSFDFTMIGNLSCRRFYPLLVLECVRTQVVMTSLSDVKRLLPTRKIWQMLRRTKNTPYYRLQGRQCMCNYQDSRAYRGRWVGSSEYYLYCLQYISCANFMIRSFLI